MNDSSWTRHSVAACLIIAAGFCWANQAPLWHTDVWVHAAYGRHILENDSFPKTDPLSPYTDPTIELGHWSWLTQITYAKLYEVGNWPFTEHPLDRVQCGAGTILAWHQLIWLLQTTFFWLAVRRIGTPGSVWPLISLGLYVLALHHATVIQRPQSLGFLFFIMLIWNLSATSLKRSQFLILPAIFALWANCHGTFPIGLGVLALFILGRFFEVRFSIRQILPLAGLGALAFLATWLNPHGPWIYEKIATFSGHPNLKTLSEWLPMKWEWHSQSAHWSYLASILLIVVVMLLGRQRPRWGHLLMILPLAIWPWLQFRTIVWWWVAVLWLLVQVCPGLALRFPTLPQWGEGSPSWIYRNIGIGLLIASLVTWYPVKRYIVPSPSYSAGTPVLIALGLQKYPGSSFFPELGQAVARYYPNGKYYGPIFASETQGEFFVWHLGEQFPTLMFTHAHVFSTAHWQKCLEVKFGEENSLNLLDEWGANLVVVETSRHEELIKKLQGSTEWEQIIVEDPTPATVESARAIFLRKIRK
ncbi:MAG: hypothetical protein R3B84_09575 [Zavarzinella sp.]